MKAFLKFALLAALGMIPGWLSAQTLAAPGLIPGIFSTATGVSFNGPFTFQVVTNGLAGVTFCYAFNATPAATVAGTCDGAPTQTYSAPFTISGTTQVQVIATQAGHTNSAVTSFTYTIAPFLPVAGTYAFNPTVQLSGPQGTNLVYTTNGTTPTQAACSPTNGTALANAGTVALTGTTTLQFISYVPGICASSSVNTAVYTVQAATTWYIRTDGGTRFSAAVPTGQCNGKFDASYASTGGTGTNQNCAYNDFRYLYSDNNGTIGWVMAGGDTAIIRGCTALASQQNPSNPNCRLGWDTGANGNPPNSWCPGTANQVCFNPTMPSGDATHHTKILGQCVGAGNCNTQNGTVAGNTSQLFAGFGLTWSFDLRGAHYVDIWGIEFTTHNHQTGGTNCTIGMGSPAFPIGCSSSPPVDDYAQNGFFFNSTSSNISFQDVYAHGFNSSPFFGPIGPGILMTRVASNFSAQAGWQFDDGLSSPDDPAATIDASYVTMNWNGCYEEYPIVHAIPARVCYDTTSSGFGDSWSGQNTTMTRFTCDHCTSDYNTKDAFIGPHTAITNMSMTNSESIGNMGADWKWGGLVAPQTLSFINNLTVASCMRLSAAFPGTPSNYNQFLTNFCRAGGNAFANVITAGSNWLIANNTVVGYNPTFFLFDCPLPTLNFSPCASTINFTNNIFYGITSGYTGAPFNPGQAPGLYFFLNGSITSTGSHNIEFGIRNGDTCGGNIICSDPLFVNEPSAGVPPESTLDNFNFHPSSSSPALLAGTTYTGLPATDHYGTATTSPPVIGAANQATGVISPTALKGVVVKGAKIQ
jgi:hypothetical protein